MFGLWETKTALGLFKPECLIHKLTQSETVNSFMLLVNLWQI